MAAKSRPEKPFTGRQPVLEEAARTNAPNEAMGASFIANQVAVARPIPPDTVHLPPAHVKEFARLQQIECFSWVSEIHRYPVLARQLTVKFLVFDICSRFRVLQSRPRQVRDDRGLI